MFVPAVIICFFLQLLRHLSVDEGSYRFKQGSESAFSYV